jgi:hypothetical protein
MAKLKVYVQSLEISAAGFVDKEGAMHSFCAPGLKEATFQGIEHQSGLFGNRYLSDENREFLMRVDGFCKNNGLKYDVVDLEGTSFLGKLILRMKGIKAPAVVFGQHTLCGILSDEDMRRLLKG